ncbi:MAG TPA: hypothetical protein DCK87_06915 [Desulfotomaculum sp.]|nr:hypothetical protein [Desulfotomaculum sp.]
MVLTGKYINNKGSKSFRKVKERVKDERNALATFCTWKGVAIKMKKFKYYSQLWRERRQKRKYLRYYEKPAADKRNFLARRFDFYSTLCLLWIITFIGLIFFFSFLSSLIFALVVTILAALTGKRLIQKKQQSLNKHRQIWLAGKKCLNAIKKQSQEEFIALIYDLFKRIPNFKEVRLNLPEENQEGKANPVIALWAVYKNHPLAIQALKTGENLIGVEYIINFVEGLKRYGFKNGILVTPAKYTPEARLMAEKYKDEYFVVLLEGTHIAELARRYQHRIYPEDNFLSQEMLLTDTSGEIKKPWSLPLKQTALGKKSKGFSYLTLGIMLFFIYLVTKKFNPYGIIYLLFAAFNLGLAIFCFFRSQDQKEPNILEEI